MAENLGKLITLTGTVIALTMRNPLHPESFMLSFKLRSKLLLAFFVITIFSAGITTAFSIFFFSEKIEQEAFANSLKNLKAAELVFHHRQERIEDTVRFLAQDDRLLRAALLNVKQKQQEYLDNFIRATRFDQIAVFDKNGQLSAQSTRKHLRDSPLLQDFSTSALLEAAKAGETLGSLENIGTAETPLLVFSAAAPLLTLSVPPRIGGIVLIRQVINDDIDFIDAMQRVISGKVVIFAAAQPVAFSGDMPELDPAVYRQLMQGINRYEVVDMTRGGYLGQYATVHDHWGKSLAVMAVRISADSYVDTADAAMFRLTFIMAGCVLIAFGFGALLAQGIIIPVRKLLEGVDRLTRGDLNHVIAMRNNDELGALAHAFNSMAGQLSSFFQMLKNTVDTLTRVSTALSAEKNLENLLQLLVCEARGVCDAHGGTLYTMERHDDEKHDPNAHTYFNRRIVCTEKGLDIHEVNISFQDTYPDLAQFNTRLKISDDDLIVPLMDRNNRPIGVLQLSKAESAQPNQAAFTRDQIEIVRALASQATVAIENAKNYETIKRQNEAFARFVPSEFLKHLGRRAVEDIRLGDAMRTEMAVLFSDIRNFTNFAELSEPEKIFHFLNDYLRAIGPCITENDGFIDKYIGDAIMALFSGGLRSPSEDALFAALCMLEKLNLFNAERIKRAELPIRIGIGIHVGPLVLGTIGFKSRMESTVIGDTVNLASRVESLTKAYGINLGITDATLAQLHNCHDLYLREIDTVQVKGRENPSVIYEVFNADAEQLKQEKLQGLETYTQALNLYKQGQWQDAEALFSKLHARYEHEKLYYVYLQRCRHFILDPPESWHGVMRLEEK